MKSPGSVYTIRLLPSLFLQILRLWIFYVKGLCIQSVVFDWPLSTPHSVFKICPHGSISA